MLKYSYLCKNWEIDKETNRHHFEWVYADPRNEAGRLTRELGMLEPGGTLVRLTRVYDNLGSVCFATPEGEIWYTGNGHASVSGMDFYFSND